MKVFVQGGGGEVKGGRACIPRCLGQTAGGGERGRKFRTRDRGGEGGDPVSALTSFSTTSTVKMPVKTRLAVCSACWYEAEAPEEG